MTSPLRRLFLPVASGLLFALAFPKAALWPLAFVALVPLLVGLRRESEAPPALRGFAWGVAFFGSLLSWLYGFFRHYGQLNPALSFVVFAILVSYLAVYPGLFAHFGSLLLQRYGVGGWALLPVLWVSLEWVRGRALTGFPWGLAGYSQSRCLPLIQISELTGVYGISFLVVGVNAVGAAWLGRGPETRRGLPGITAAVGLLGAASLIFGYGEMARRTQEPTLRVGLVQASIPQDAKWSPALAGEILARHERLSAEAAEKGARLVFWPESSSPFSLSYPATGAAGPRVAENRAYRERLQALALRLKIALILGTVDYRATPEGVRPVNAAALVRRDGTWGETYAKIHLVPFGEYVPLQRVLLFVNRMVRGAIGDFLPGSEPIVLHSDDLPVGTTICYEMIFPELVRLFPLKGARVLANLTNDAWFGTSAGPHQHFDMTIFRAVENRRYLVRAANTGISAIVDPFGRVTSRTRLGESRMLVGEVGSRSRITPYARFGDVFAILCVILAAAALAAALAAPGASKGEATGGSE